MEGKIRSEVATGVGGEADDSWDQVGKRVEESVRLGLGKWAGAESEDDWETIGLKMQDKIKTSLQEWLGGECGHKGKTPDPLLHRVDESGYPD